MVNKKTIGQVGHGQIDLISMTKWSNVTKCQNKWFLVFMMCWLET